MAESIAYYEERISRMEKFLRQICEITGEKTVIRQLAEAALHDPCRD